MTRRPVYGLVAVVAAVCIATVAAVLTTRSPERPAASAAAASPTPSGVPVVLPGRPGGPAVVTDSTKVRAPDGSTYNGIDVAFARMMIPHHVQAVRMAVMAPKRAADQRVLGLAARIRAAQVPEIRQLRAWLQARRLEETAPGHDHGRMYGMQTDAAMRRLASSRGAAFDRLFLAMMTAHHRGALTMAGDAVAGGDDLTIEQMANEMAVEQAAEINRMRQLNAR
jgi:uncharacterized protein (DUF305 family)